MLIFAAFLNIEYIYTLINILLIKQAVCLIGKKYFSHDISDISRVGGLVVFGLNLTRKLQGILLY